jgi:hypothetical protein
MRGTLTHARAPLVLIAPLALVLFAATAAAQGRTPPGAGVPDDPLARHRWSLEITAHGAIETWNYNANHENMAGHFAGVTYGIREGLAVKVASPLYYVWQRGTDAYLFGLTWGVRGRLAKKPRWSAFWEFEVGVSEADTYVPPRGTRFNYLAIGGGGVIVRIRPGVHALGGLRWVHVSNNSLAGRSRNPDIEAVGPTIGLLYGF